MRGIGVIGLALISALGVAPMASARPDGQVFGAEGRVDAPEGLQPGIRQADGRGCIKQCPDDMLPCDPPAFKQADGRCAQEQR